MLISPTEPFPFKKIGKSSSLPEKYGADMLIVANKLRTGVQRKKFPSDFTASVADGRLYEQVHLMQQLDRRVVVLEGFGKWTEDGELIDKYVRFTRAQFQGILFSLTFEFGVQVLQVRTMSETIGLLQALETWCKKTKHLSLAGRPGPKKDSWGSLKSEAYGMHLLQSFPGIGPKLAQDIYQHFGTVPIKWDLDGAEELEKVKGVGEGRAQAMWKVLE